MTMTDAIDPARQTWTWQAAYAYQLSKILIGLGKPDAVAHAAEYADEWERRTRPRSRTEKRTPPDAASVATS